MADPFQTLMYFTLTLGHCHENLWGFFEDQINFDLLPKIFKETLCFLFQKTHDPTRKHGQITTFRISSS